MRQYAKGPAAADAADISSANKGAGDLPQDPAMQSGLWDDVSIDDAESGDEARVVQVDISSTPC